MIELPWRPPFLIGVVHLPPTPGTPGAPPAAESMRRLMQGALEDAAALLEGGCDGLLVENFGDRPFYPERVPAVTVGAMALAVRAVVELAGGVPVGVNVLRNDAAAALGLCAATGAGFLRVNVHAGAMVTDQGVLEGRAHETLRERDRLGVGARVLADVQVKHAAPLARIPLGTAARDLIERAGADAVIVTGDATGAPPDAEEVRIVRGAVGAAPVIVGSGVTLETAEELLAEADGAIVGTALKRDGRVEARVDPERVRRMAALLRGR